MRAADHCRLRRHRSAQPACLRGSGFRSGSSLRASGQAADGAQLRAGALRLRPGDRHGAARSPQRGADKRCGAHGHHARRSDGRIRVLPGRPRGSPPTVPAAGSLDACAGISPLHRVRFSRTQLRVLHRVHVLQSRAGRCPRSGAREQGGRRRRRGLRPVVADLVRRLQRDAQRHPEHLPPIRSKPRRARPRRRVCGADRGGRRLCGPARHRGARGAARLRTRLRRPQHDRARSDRGGTDHLHAPGHRHGRPERRRRGSDLRPRHRHPAQRSDRGKGVAQRVRSAQRGDSLRIDQVDARAHPRWRGSDERRRGARGRVGRLHPADHSLRGAGPARSGGLLGPGTPRIAEAHSLEHARVRGIELQRRHRAGRRYRGARANLAHARANRGMHSAAREKFAFSQRLQRRYQHGETP